MKKLEFEVDPFLIDYVSKFLFLPCTLQFERGIGNKAILLINNTNPFI